MSSFDDIRRGLAANLAVLRADGYQVSPWLLDAPASPTIQVAGLTDVDYDIQFRDSSNYDNLGDRLTVVIEAAITRKVDIGAQMLLDKLHGSASLKRAIEADQQLTSRWNDDQTVTTGHPKACDDLRVARYRGQAPTVLQSAEFLVATWEVDILT